MASELEKLAAYEEAARVCERMVVGGRAWNDEQRIAAGALLAAAKNIRALASAPAPQQARAEGVPAGWKLVGWVYHSECDYDHIHRCYGNDGDPLVRRIPSGGVPVYAAASPEPPTAANVTWRDVCDAMDRIPVHERRPTVPVEPAAQEGDAHAVAYALELLSVAKDSPEGEACMMNQAGRDLALRAAALIRSLAQPVGEVDEAAAELQTILNEARAAGYMVDTSVPFDVLERAIVALTAARLPAGAGGVAFDFAAHLAHQREWSEATFGPGPRTAGVCDHIRKELQEVEAAPHDSEEWIDVIILALDGAWRAGMSPQQIIAGIVAKQAKNEARTWPDWRTADPSKAIEHDRSNDAWPREGDLVRYGDGSTALAILCEPHAGGWHGVQCMGGYTFFSRVYPPSEADMRKWLECAKWRRERPTTEADERIRTAIRPATNDQVKP